jgi:hypothetical protein
VGSIFGLALAGIGLEELLAALRRRGAAGRRWAVGAAIAAIGIVTVEGTYHARRYLTMAPHAEALPEAEYRDFFAADPSLYRVASLERFTINAGWAASRGVQLVTGFDSYNYTHYFVYFHLMATGQVLPARAKVWYELGVPARLDLLDALNVKYVVAPAPLEVAGTPLEPAVVLRDQPVFRLYSGIGRWPLFIYRNTRCLDRAWWAGTLGLAASDDDMAHQVFQSDLHARTVVLAAPDSAIVNQPSPGNGLTITSWAPGRVTLRTHTGASRFLVVSEVWNPAWRVRIDGRKAPKFQTDIALIGLAVPAGDHEVTLEFVPPYWSAACGITITSAAAVVLLAALGVAKRARARKNPQRGQLGGDSSSRR